MTGYIANTDSGWFEFLRSLPAQEEVNFWNPSDHYLFRGPVGSPFLFRLKAPINVIGGFGARCIWRTGCAGFGEMARTVCPSPHTPANNSAQTSSVTVPVS